MIMLRPCAGVEFRGERLKFLRAACSDIDGEAGRVAAADPKAGLIIACGKGAEH